MIKLNDMVGMSLQNAIKRLSGSWRRSLVKALIIICIAMAVASMVLIGMYLIKGNVEIGEWLFVLVSSIFNVFLLYSFL